MKEHSEHEFVQWLGLELGLSMSVAFLLYWPISAIWLPLPHRFEQVFASADVLSLSALILLGVSCEIEQSRLFHQVTSRRLLYMRIFAMVLGFLFVLCYGFAKYRYVTYTFPPATAFVDATITQSAQFSLAAACFTIGYATWCKMCLMRARAKGAQ